MELNYWTRTFSTLTLEASLLAGFGFGGLSAIKDYKGHHGVLNILYLVSTSCSMGFGLLCITTCALMLNLAPGKALMANSMETIDFTIDEMKTKSTQAFWYFMGELVFFHISS